MNISYIYFIFLLLLIDDINKAYINTTKNIIFISNMLIIISLILLGVKIDSFYIIVYLLCVISDFIFISIRNMNIEYKRILDKEFLLEAVLYAFNISIKLLSIKYISGGY